MEAPLKEIFLCYNPRTGLTKRIHQENIVNFLIMPGYFVYGYVPITAIYIPQEYCTREILSRYSVLSNIIM